MSNVRFVPALTARQAHATARKMYLSGHYCSEAILAAIGQAWAKDYDPKILKMAFPFGGGLAGKTDLCGCVSGAAMALGLLYGRTSTSGDTEPCWTLTQRFHERFNEQLGSTSCEFFTQGKFTKINHLKCYRLVAKSVRILWGLIEEERAEHRSGVDVDPRAESGVTCETA